MQQPTGMRPTNVAEALAVLQDFTAAFLKPLPSTCPQERSTTAHPTGQAGKEINPC